MSIVQIVVLAAGLLVVVAIVALAPKTRRPRTAISTSARRPAGVSAAAGRPWGEQVGMASAAQADAQAAREHEIQVVAARRAARRPSERRETVRRPVSRPAWVVRAGSEEAPQRTFTVDLAERGALVAGPASLTPGEHVLLRLDLQGFGEVECAAEVIRVTPEGHRALAFHALPKGLADAFAAAAA